VSVEKRIRRALLSVTDKTGLVEFAQALAGFGVEPALSPRRRPIRATQPSSGLVERKPCG